MFYYTTVLLSGSDYIITFVFNLTIQILVKPVPTLSFQLLKLVYTLPFPHIRYVSNLGLIYTVPSNTKTEKRTME